MISFYPGPSRVHDAIPRYVADAHRAGIMSINHRSKTFVTMSQKIVTLLKDRLRIPRNYTILYTGSATECWEIIAQSLIREGSAHVYNGAFGEKWYQYTHRLHPGVQAYPFEVGRALNIDQLAITGRPDLVCITHNETSNGTAVSMKSLRALRKQLPHSLLAVDATSSMAGVNLDFRSADIWFASVQKCFGLPAGLGLMICSPAAVERARQINDQRYYNSMPFMLDMMEKFQTPFTPNVLNLYLLSRVLEKMPDIREVDATTVKRYDQWMTFLGRLQHLHHLVDNPKVHSQTVIPLQAEPGYIQAVKEKAAKHNILLGEGYGAWKATTLRIANFPAIKAGEIRLLQSFLKDF